MYGRAVVGADVVDRRDVRVVQAARRLRLLLEAPQPVGVLRVRRRQHLDRDVALQPLVARPVHLAHPAGADRREDLVGTEPNPLSGTWGGNLGRARRRRSLAEHSRRVPFRSPGRRVSRGVLTYARRARSLREVTERRRRAPRERARSEGPGSRSRPHPAEPRAGAPKAQAPRGALATCWLWGVESNHEPLRTARPEKPASVRRSLALTGSLRSPSVAKV